MKIIKISDPQKICDNVVFVITNTGKIYTENENFGWFERKDITKKQLNEHFKQMRKEGKKVKTIQIIGEIYPEKTV